MQRTDGAKEVHHKLATVSGLFVLLALSTASSGKELARTDVRVAGHTFLAEVADDDQARSRGLMFRRELAPDAAMLFVFESEQPLEFWMKNTRIALDILYFDATGRLVSMQTDVPPCRVALCPQYPSEHPARFVVEVPAGTAKRLGIRLGAELCWPPEFAQPLLACSKKGEKREGH